MEQNTLNKNIWNAAGTAGLALGAISSAYLFAGQLIAGNLSPATLWQQVLSLILWGLKFAMCILIMKLSMAKYAYETKASDKKQIFKMGVAAALLSSLVYSGFYLANMLYISPEFYNMVFETTINEMSASIDSNSAAALEKLKAYLPQIVFLSNFIYCFLFGTVLSAILSRNISPKDPLAEFKTEQK